MREIGKLVSITAAAVMLGLPAYGAGSAPSPSRTDAVASAPASAPAGMPSSAPPGTAPGGTQASGDAAARHAKRTACLKEAKAKKLLGAAKTSFIKTCIGAP
jgi:hypothetical protein